MILARPWESSQDAARRKPFLLRGDAECKAFSRFRRRVHLRIISRAFFAALFGSPPAGLEHENGSRAWSRRRSDIAVDKSPLLTGRRWEIAAGFAA